MAVKLSIITVNLNNREGLQKTIDSVVSQTFTDYEYIIIDGGSTDGSVDIIKQYEDRITYWISEPDNGVYNAMNKGIIQAKGEYCNFLNSGDYYAENILNKVFCDNSNDDIIYGNCVHIINNLRKEIKFPATLTMLNFFHTSINHQSTFIKKKLFDVYGYYDETLENVSDWKFFLQTIILNNCSTKYLDSVIVYFDGTGISSTRYHISVKERECIQNEYIPRFVSDYILLKRLVNSDYYQIYEFLRSKKTIRFLFHLAKKIIKIIKLITKNQKKVNHENSNDKENCQ
jgi:glycosyltransferase involved in cell wall biosynthesis